MRHFVALKQYVLCFFIKCRYVKVYPTRLVKRTGHHNTFQLKHNHFIMNTEI